ncbi:tRNA 2-thiouridine(34) synthase MnmA [Patescibacteria group bacterium]|nr:tRNA 2-thiouridine(34) synthase MnmA [Patescibacteria group bacterium]
MAREIPKKSKIAVGLSGGVDSSVSALILKKAGFEVTGVHMQCWDYDAKGCTGKQDRADAVATASVLGLPFVALDFVHEYSELVMKYFYSEYKAGRTPNPDILCNKEIKFGLFLNWALQQGFDYIATGHYAGIDFNKSDGLYELMRPVDLSKDQSYFLYALNQAQLNHAIFPLSNINKSDVRRIAELNGLPSAAKPDSVGICFVGNVEIREFLKQNAGFKEEKGVVLNLSGKVIGDHNGAVFFTIGQRHGFTISDYTGVPLYVLNKNIKKNEIIVGTYEDCMLNSFEMEGIHWIGTPFTEDFECEVRIRHLGQLYKGKVAINGCKVVLHEKAFGIASGQSAVLYTNDKILGGGVIKC